MGKSLVIVESPAKAKTINKFLGSNFVVKASMGHIRDLPKSKLGVDVENSFQPEYVTVRGKGKIIKELKEAAKTADAVYLAPDPDREGEAIAWHIASVLNNANIHRVSFNEITKSAIQAAVEHPSKIDMQKVDAQQARRVLDRLVGYKVSPLLWKTISYGLSAGRVQTVALRLICEREAEIEVFVPEEYWSITARLIGDAETPFNAQLIKINNKKAKIENEEQANQIVSDLKNETYRVKSVTRKEKKRKPAPPFITSTLQQDASRRLGFSSKKTMQVAQQLYEGLEVKDEGSIGLITYMRTDSTRIADEALNETREYIQKELGEEYLPPKAIHYSAKKGAQDAHEAIRPTSILRTPESLKRDLTKDQYRLYELIWKRLVASQMNPAIYDTTTVDIEAGNYLLRATGSIIKFMGFLSLYQEATDDNGNNKDGNGNKKDEILPVIVEGELLKLLELIPKQHFTQPPPRFTEASLVKELEALGIGRPSTYASIVSTIQDRNYVVSENKRLQPTNLGRTVSSLLIKVFPDIFDVEFTAKMESDLDQVETGNENWVVLMQRFYTPFNQTVEEIDAKSIELKQSLQEKTELVCDKCGSPMIKKWGRNGQFLACSAYPECKNTKPIEAEDEPVETDEKCEKCNNPMIIKTGRYGRFLACSNYPECKNTKPISIGVDCPKCETGYITEKRSRRGKVFYGCSNYPDCDFVVWKKPVSKPCLSCQAPFLVYNNTKTRGEYLECLECKTRHDLDGNLL